MVQTDSRASLLDRIRAGTTRRAFGAGAVKVKSIVHSPLTPDMLWKSRKPIFAWLFVLIPMSRDRVEQWPDQTCHEISPGSMRPLSGVACHQPFVGSTLWLSCFAAVSRV